MSERVFEMNIYIPGMHVIFGPKFSGKTERIITIAQRYKHGGQRIQVFKYKWDGLEGKLRDNNGREIPAQDVVGTGELLVLRKPADIYFIDGAHFLDYRIIDVLVHWVKKGKAVVCAFPESNFRGERLLLRKNPDSEELSDRSVDEFIFAADYILPLSAVCAIEEYGERCSSPAIRTQMLINGKPAKYSVPQFFRGSKRSEVSYEPRCIYHHKVPGKRRP